MQEKTFNTDKDKQESTTPLGQPNEETTDAISDDGVVYVVDEEGGPMDLSDRTYVSVEEMGEEENVDDEDESPADDKE